MTNPVAGAVFENELVITGVSLGPRGGKRHDTESTARRQEPMCGCLLPNGHEGGGGRAVER